jgi:hypothetical protein
VTPTRTGVTGIGDGGANASAMVGMALSDDKRGGSGRGARFMVRNGDAVVAVRCDGSEPMRACVDATLTLLDRVRSMPPAPTSSPGPGSTQPPR